MSELTRHAPVVIETGPPELQERNTWVATRLLASSTAFLFLPFVFAYLYLASLNTAGLWRPDRLKAPFGWGLAIMLTLVVSALLIVWARAELKRGRASKSRWLSVAALCAGVTAVVLQAIEYSRLGFGPADGGHASVFVGWSGLFAVAVLAAMVWLETIVAAGFRNGNTSPGSAQSDLNAVAFYLTFLAGLGIFTFVFLYLV
jgi:heme/copper-type cytochrome/quinol oxidase subunit 3